MLRRDTKIHKDEDLDMEVDSLLSVSDMSRDSILEDFEYEWNSDNVKKIIDILNYVDALAPNIDKTYAQNTLHAQMLLSWWFCQPISTMHPIILINLPCDSKRFVHTCKITNQ
jgi:hypothetical protein